MPLHLRSLLCFFLLVWSFSGSSQVNPDLVVLSSGNRINGEVKSLNFSILSFDTDKAGLLKIKWKDVEKIRSTQELELYLPNGDLVIGTLDTTAKAGVLKFIGSEGESRIIPMEEITSFREVNKSFWSRVDGFIKLGFSYTKASDVAQFNTSAEVTYRNLHDEVSLSGSTIFTIQKNTTDSVDLTRQQNMYLRYRRFFNHKRFINISTGLEQNTELGLLSRVISSVTAGKTLFDNKSQFFQAYGGTAYSWERSDDGSKVSNSEGVVGIYYKVYRHQMPKIYLTATATSYPSFSNPGRVRVIGQLDLDLELFNDFTIGLSNYHNFDNQPVSATGSTYDWGIVFNLGYSF